MSRLRVLVSDVAPALLREILEHAAAERGDVGVVSRSVERRELVEAIERDEAEAVFLALDEKELPPACIELFDRFPRLAIVGMVSNGRRAAIYVNDFGADDLFNMVQVWKAGIDSPARL